MIHRLCRMTPLVQDSKCKKRERKLLIGREFLQWKLKHSQNKYDHCIKGSPWNRVAYFSYVTRVVVSSYDITIPTFQTLLSELGLFVAWNSGCCKIYCGKDKISYLLRHQATVENSLFMTHEALRALLLKKKIPY